MRPLSAIATIAGAAAAAATLAPAAGAACSAPVPDARTSVVDCRAVGHEQLFDVPAGVTRLTVTAGGAGGGGGTGGSSFGEYPGPGGTGALATAELAVTPGRRLFVLVGGRGGTRALGGAGGFNGGGAGGGSAASGGGGGGGASDVRTCSTADPACDTLASRLVVAGGAGGGGGGGGGNVFFAVYAGAGGGVGADGTAASGTGSDPGRGATARAGGEGGAGAGAGRLGFGGAGGPSAEAGGGGGGGWFGGGGGGPETTSATGGSGGGAGSSFGPAGTRVAQSPLPQGLVRISYATPSAGNPLPSVTIARPRSGATVGGRGLVVSGRARDGSGVRGVALRIERVPRAAGRCTWLDPVAGLRRGSCDEPPSLPASLRSSGSWRYRVAKLRPGSYRVTAYGTDETGIYGNSAPASARTARFRVRR
jgi:hypothetical protein